MDTLQTKPTEAAGPTGIENNAKGISRRSDQPLDAFAFGRSLGRIMIQLYPDGLLHVLAGVRTRINEIRDRRGEVAHES